jgi:hypothetical protein
LITLLEETRSETLKYFELSDPDLDRGVRMLKDEMEKVASHNEHHLAHIRRALMQSSISSLTS